MWSFGGVFLKGQINFSFESTRWFGPCRTWQSTVPPRLSAVGASSNSHVPPLSNVMTERMLSSLTEPLMSVAMKTPRSPSTRCTSANGSLAKYLKASQATGSYLKEWSIRGIVKLNMHKFSCQISEIASSNKTVHTALVWLAEDRVSETLNESSGRITPEPTLANPPNEVEKRQQIINKWERADASHRITVLVFLLDKEAHAVRVWTAFVLSPLPSICLQSWRLSSESQRLLW